MTYESLPLGRVDVTAAGFRGAEGVVVDREGSLYGGGSDGVIRKLTPQGRVHEIARIEGLPAGLALDRRGNLFVCNMGRGGVLRVSPDGKVEPFVDRVADVPLVAPNFPVFDSEGNLYVSNSTDFSATDSERFMAEIRDPAAKGALVRLRPDGTGEVVAKGLYFANGVAIDPQEEAVYVLQSTRQNCVRIPIRKDGTHGQPEPYGPPLGGLCDGMAFDAEGNLVITLPLANKVVVLSTEGKLVTLLEDPDGKTLAMPSNCAFGGGALEDLYLTALQADHMSRIHLGRRGHPLYHNR